MKIFLKAAVFFFTTLTLLPSAKALISASVSAPSPVTTSSTFTVSASGSCDQEPLTSLWVTKNGLYFGGTSGSGYDYSLSFSSSDTAPSSAGSIAYYAYADSASYSASGGTTVTVNAPPPTNTAPTTIFDYVAGSVNQNQTLSGSGWATDNEDGAPVTSVKIYIDGSYAFDATRGGYRPDVASAYGRSDFTYSGWSFSWNVGTLSVGTHSIRSYAYDSQSAQGTDYDAKTFTVNVGPSTPTATVTLDNGSIFLGQSTTVRANYTIDTAHGDSMSSSSINMLPSGGSESVVASGSGNLTYTFAPSAAGSYTFKALAQTTGYPSSTIYATTTATVYNNPSGLSGSGITATGFTLNWTGVGASLYEVSRNGTSLGTTTSTNFSVSGSPSTTYAMAVRAQAGGTWSAWTSTVNITTTADTTAPSVPPGLSVGSVATTTATVTWSASSDNVAVTGYEVFLNGISAGTTSSTNFNLTGLAPGVAYTVTVRSRDAVPNWSAQSAGQNFTTGTYTGSDLVIANITYPSGSNLLIRSGGGILTSGTVVIASGAIVTFSANTSVRLEPGFRATSGSFFHAVITADADGDGIPDVWETAHGLNPTNPADASAASSGNADITNLEAYLLGLDPATPATSDPLQLNVHRPKE